jgi:hypothetical protein
MKHEQAQNRRALSTKSRGTRSARVSLQKRAIPVARERNPTRHTHGKRVLPGTRGKRVSRGATPVARERDPTATRGKRVFQTHNPGRAGAQPYPPRAGNALSRCATPVARERDPTRHARETRFPDARRHADTPTRRHADTPTRRHADTPTRLPQRL